ncbi:ATPase [Methylobacterium sp. Leaf469]|uniref:ATP-binding protein n=1 Tax=Methylobacterium sp. Leaf469 TaxID=1736387 RepID=UPI0006FE1276|nr:ATP-binding protein [Methylobacterium sp. Leaf469]KQU01843.1 ATPase [Methylobacterium sp. Leaf469]
MIESLRGLGYSTATALADIIDNSIAAGARSVAVRFKWARESSWVSILDDGTGMTDPELERAMRLGDRSPDDVRAQADLGRFGLGLKTASFSQCRSLTVASRKGGQASCLRWDLDVLATGGGNEWRLLEGAGADGVSVIASLGEWETGTLVLWEKLDRIVSPGSTEQDFLDLIDTVERHLAMTYHRYLDGSRPRLTLLLNGRRIAPWDPFVRDHPATWSSPVSRLRTASGLVEIECHVLPHRDRLDPGTYEMAAGPDGWTAQQGFYVYRNARLLLAGSWLGLGQGRAWTKEEAHRLARIRLDIPNTADTEWKIDIRKSTARPPPTVKPKLVKLAEYSRERARRVFAFRGQPSGRIQAEPLQTAWTAEHFRAGMRYRIDKGHPAVRAVLEEAGPLASSVEAMLRVIEESIPVQRIWLDTAEARETPRTGFAGEAPAEVSLVLQTLFRNLLRKGLSPELAREQLRRTEPFQLHPGLVDALKPE